MATKAAVLVAAAAIALAGCSSHTTAHQHTTPVSTVLGGRASLADLYITDAIVPAPASPDVAAAYFTVANHGSTADDLVAVSSDVSADTSLHTYSGASMVALSKLTVPARGIARLAVGSYHVMIMTPTRALAVGDQVRLTLTFARAGAVTVTAPVVASTGPVGDMGSMPGMQ